MKNYTPTNPTFNQSVPVYERNDPADGDQMASPLKQLQDNIVAMQAEGVSGRVLSLEGDVTSLAFQLALAGLIDTSTLETIVVDEIDSASAVTILSGLYDNTGKKVYI